MNTAQAIREGEAKLVGLDPVLGGLIQSQEPMVYTQRGSGDYFHSLCRTIIGQQVSVKAAATIFGRFEKVTKLDPKRVARLTEAQTKEIGLSRQKLSYLHDLAGHFVENPKIYNHLEQQTDEQVLEELVAVKGIGIWTAQMFLMFTLGRLDVFAPDDIGLQRAMKELYGWEAVPPKKELAAIAERWSPYRTVACWHLWQSLNNEPL